MLDRIYTYLQEKAPLDTCESWDNSGMLIRGNQPVNKALLTLDITPEVVAEAAEKGCQLIIAHHPVIFRGVKKVGYDDVVFQLIRHNISAICMHTNLDAAPGGVNDVLAKLIGLENVERYEEIGRVGELPQEMTVREIGKHLAKTLQSPVKFSMADKKVKKVALIGGSAGEYWEMAKSYGADLFVSGEASHHHSLDARAAGVAILVAGHWNSERPVMDILQVELQNAIPEVAFLLSEADCDPFSYEC